MRTPVLVREDGSGLAGPAGKPDLLRVESTLDETNGGLLARELPKFPEPFNICEALFRKLPLKNQALKATRIAPSLELHRQPAGTQSKSVQDRVVGDPSQMCKEIVKFLSR
jgi:hypothetical protein